MRKNNKKEKAINVVTTGLEYIETGLTIAGAFVPLVGAIGGGIGLFNKIYAKKNFEYFAQKIESIEIKLNELTEEQKRDFVFRVVDVVNKVLNSRTLEKIDNFTNVIKNGIINSSILQDSDEIDQVIDLVDKLNFEDIEFLERFYQSSRHQLEKGNEFFEPLESTYFENIHYMNKLEPEQINHYGFKRNSITQLQKCIGYGLITQEFDAKQILDAAKVKDSPSSHFHRKANFGFKYIISSSYLKLREYLKNN